MDIKYISSHIDTKSIPKVGVEVAFIGRSNVGKSSLINTVSEKKLCFVSKKPGKTVTINVFADSYLKYAFIDLPGYGFAKTQSELQQKWTTLIPEYLINRSSLKMIFVLIDIRIGFMQNDVDAINLMLEANRPLSLVFTKTDKLNNAEIAEAKEEINKIMKDLSQVEKIYFVSNKDVKKYDILLLKKDLHEILRNRN